MGLDDAALIRRAKGGDLAAFEQLVSAYGKKAYNLAYRLCGDREDAADLAQEAFLRMYRALGRFREEARFSTWLHRIVLNACLDHQRARGRKPSVSLEGLLERPDEQRPRELPSPDPDPAETAERQDLRAGVQAAIGRLDPDHRTALVLRDLDGLSYEEIALVLGVALGTVKSRINRARHALKTELLHAELLPARAVYHGDVVTTGKEGEAQ